MTTTIYNAAEQPLEVYDISYLANGVICKESTKKNNVTTNN